MVDFSMKNYGKMNGREKEQIRLANCHKTTPRTIAKMGKDEFVSMEIRGGICKYFGCDVSEILEYRVEEEHDR